MAKRAKIVLKNEDIITVEHANIVEVLEDVLLLKTEKETLSVARSEISWFVITDID